MITVMSAKNLKREKERTAPRDGKAWTDYRLKLSLTNLIRWPMRTMQNLISFQRRYVLLSPNFIKTQLIYDRQKKKLFTVTVRDSVDCGVLDQVYLAENYCLQRLERYPNLIALYQTICDEKRMPLILDLGAHSGIAATYFKREFPEAKVIAVEPDAANLEAARMNLAKETNVDFVLGAVSCESGKGQLLDSGLGSWGYRTEHGAGSIEFLTVNSILGELPTSQCTPFVAKIDIEGFEQDLFMSNTEWVDRFPLVIIELHDRLFPGEGNSSTFLKCIAALDRDFIYINENIFSIKNGLS